MRSNDAVESIERHAENEQRTAEAGVPEKHGGHSTIPVLVGREVHLMHAVQVRRQS